MALFACLLFAAGVPAAFPAGRTAPKGAKVPLAQGQTALARIPLRFESNQGQFASPVRFGVRERGFNLSLTDSGAVMTFADSTRLAMTLGGSSPAAAIEGQDPFPARTNYFLGSRDHWHTDIANYARVRYREVYPGVDVVYYGAQNRLEYDFVLAPGADPNRIRLEFSGARRLRITRQGDLEVETAAGPVTQLRPIAYQEDGGTRRAVGGRYVLLADNAVGFRVDRFDRKRQLVIDPSIVYSTYMGGSLADQINAVNLFSDGRLFIVGQTSSTDLGYINGAYNNFISGVTNVFMAIIDTSAQGNFALLYLSYIGGSGIDIPVSVQVDASGLMYVAGTTTSTDFPVSSNAYQSTGAATTVSSFIFQLDPHGYGGVSLLYSTFFSGTTGNDTVTDMVLDNQGNVYLIGTTLSSDFPVTPNAYAGVLYGPQDAFISEFNIPNNTLVYSTYIGGQTDDFGSGIALISPGVVYFAINTESPDFPTNGFGSKFTLGGGIDMALGVLDMTQAGNDGLVYSTYYGGSDLDEVRAITVDNHGNLVVTGYTLSSDFPVTSDAMQKVNHGNGDAFVSVVNPNAPGFVVYSTFLGGNDGDVGYAVAVDAQGYISVTGYTQSSDFPVFNAVQPQWGQGIDIFLTRFKPGVPGLAAIQHSTYMGFNNVNVGRAMAVGADGTVYLAGSTQGQLPVWPNPSQGSYGGGASDGFVMVISPN